MNKIGLLIILLSVYGCTSGNNSRMAETKISSTQKRLVVKQNFNQQTGNRLTDFQKKIYLKIDEIHTGGTYINKDGISVFNRILIVPEEENIMLINECISVGEEGVNYKLVKMSRLTDDGSALPKFGINRVQSLKFIDSVRVEGVFNDEKKIINLDSLKDYRDYNN